MGWLGAVTSIGKEVFKGAAKDYVGSKLKPSTKGTNVSGNQLPMPLPGQTGGFGLPRGVDNKLQLPWHDPSIPAAMKPFALDDSFLKSYVRAPKGYVVVRDPNGRPYAILKSYARSNGLWTPAKKPPISVRDWHAFKKAQAVAKKLRKIARPALHKYHKAESASCHTRKGK